MKRLIWKAIPNLAWLALVASISMLYLATIPDSILDAMSPMVFVVISAILGGLVFTPANNLSRIGWQGLTTYFKTREIQRERKRWENSGKSSDVSDSTLYALWKHRNRNDSIWRVAWTHMLVTLMGAIAATAIAVFIYLLIYFISGGLIQNIVVANILFFIFWVFVAAFMILGIVMFAMVMLAKAEAHN